MLELLCCVMCWRMVNQPTYRRLTAPQWQALSSAWGSVVTISSGGESSSWIVVTQRTFPSEEAPSYTEKPPLYRDVSKTPSRTTSTQEVRASTHQRCSCCWSSGLCCVLWHLCNILSLRVSWGKRNLELMVVTWDEALNVAKDRSEWRNCDDKHTASL